MNLGMLDRGRWSMANKASDGKFADGTAKYPGDLRITSAGGTLAGVAVETVGSGRIIVPIEIRDYVNRLMYAGASIDAAGEYLGTADTTIRLPAASARPKRLRGWWIRYLDDDTVDETHAGDVDVPTDTVSSTWYPAWRDIHQLWLDRDDGVVGLGFGIEVVGPGYVDATTRIAKVTDMAALALSRLKGIIP